MQPARRGTTDRTPRGATNVRNGTWRFPSAGGVCSPVRFVPICSTGARNSSSPRGHRSDSSGAVRLAGSRTITTRATISASVPGDQGRARAVGDGAQRRRDRHVCRHRRGDRVGRVGRTRRAGRPRNRRLHHPSAVAAPPGDRRRRPRARRARTPEDPLRRAQLPHAHPRDGPRAPEPSHLFAKYALALTGRDPIPLPPVSEQVDWEAELAVVIGRPVRDAEPDEAAAAIAGYAVLNDVSMRDWQYRTLQWLQGKTFERATPLGPVAGDARRVSGHAARPARHAARSTASSCRTPVPPTSVHPARRRAYIGRSSP